MSVDGTKVLFEGFLQKRKDTMKIMWVTYWFRLQNTTLFFYTKRNGSALHLRGHYYIYKVQSVREVQKTTRNLFMFEMIMECGKRKMLAAETAALRTAWLTHIWEAMHLSGSGLFYPRNSLLKVCVQQNDLRTTSSQEDVHTDGVMDQFPAQPHPNQENDISSSFCLLVEQNNEETANQDTETHQQLITDLSIDDPQWSTRTAEGNEGVYDVLPRRDQRMRQETPPDCVYDTPLSYRTLFKQQENIYDVPSSMLRKTNNPIDETPENRAYGNI